MCTICNAFTPHASDCAYQALTEIDPNLAEPNTVGQGATTVTEASDASASRSTNYTASIGEFFHGELSSNSDADWIAVELDAGTTYTFAMVGIGALDEQINDTYLRLRNSNGNVIDQNDDVDSTQGNSYLYSHITYTATSSGTYYLDAQSWGNNSSGTYGLSMVEGTTASYDAYMSAGSLLRPEASWANNPETSANVTWAFRDSGPAFDITGASAPFSRFTSAQREATSAVMEHIDDLTGLNFTQVTDGDQFTNSATILFGNYDAMDGAGAYAYFPSTASLGGDVWLNVDAVSTSNLDYGSYSYFTLLHEVGHALGLAHPGTYNATAGQTFSYTSNAFYAQDTHQFTVMSYFDESNSGANIANGGNASTRYPDTLLLHDLLALHQLYGAETDYNSGNTRYGFNATDANSVYDFTFNTDPFLSIYDGNGIDTLDLSGSSANQVISLIEGSFSDVMGFTGTVSIAIGAKIENAVGGSGHDEIIGNALNNKLDGKEGNDSFRGGDGNDSIGAGNGADTIYADDGFDLVGAGGGNDLVYGGLGFDNLRGGSGNDSIYGGNGNDSIYGNAGDDFIDAGAGFDFVNEVDNAGRDTIHGGFGNDTIFSGRGDDSVRGDDGNDHIFGGRGRDIIEGGRGNDYLYGEGHGDTFIFEDDHGHDTIFGFEYFLSGEQIDLSDVSGINTLNDVLGAGGAATQTSAGVVITTGANSSITLNGLDLNQLNADDFLF